MKLSGRLQKVADWVPDGSVMADIGSDHAYLPVFLVEANRVIRAVAGELNQGPFESAKRTVQEYGFAERIEVRKGNGLQVLHKNEVNLITVCGMGGGTIVEILSAGEEKLAGVQRLVLQPMADSDRLRHWLHQHGWKIAAEELVADDGILYEIVVAEPGAEQYDDPLWYEIGSLQLLQNDPLFGQKLQNELDKIDRALENLQYGKGETAIQKKEAFLERRKRIEEVMRQCK
ncbi:tRNA (adenine(22)-N(1))-methyltransferase [Effusibacillus dendaii]|uniref:SAM-dependent methyltransferase n=1 Tax=Effusibacillus dendaii TaxID=2743772 RepID=A0A7I8DA10_9BACL|nr:class I SAM-dependent methyltransferase [Effusibacillus dendaii]BCJ86202.1 hypothetical protein skT53_11870 [Effusibacillus dendaii]